MLPVEIERRWLFSGSSALDGLDYCSTKIVQGYLDTNSDMAMRVRISEELDTGLKRGYLTFKGRKNGDGVAIELEYEIPIPDATFLLSKCSATVRKTRHAIGTYFDILHADVFVFDGVERCIVEVEFDSVLNATAFTPPDWFGHEITKEPGFSNYELAHKGWPC